MKRSLLFFLFCVVQTLFVINACWAEEPILKSNHPDTYTVVKGDTLWDISGRFLQNPWMWPEIWQVNPEIKNPHLIYPGDVLNLIYINGRPRLVFGSRGAGRGDGSGDGYGRDVKLSPEIRVQPLENAIPAIPLDKIAAFLSESRILSDKELEESAHVLAGGGEHLVMGPGDTFYARGKIDSNVANYGIYRKGDVYKDPETKEILGYEAKDIASAKVTALNEDVTTLSLIRTSQEVRINDRLLPNVEQRINSVFFPSAPSKPIKGVIIAVEDGVTQVGNLDIVILNKGIREGLEVGNVLAVYKHGLLIKDPVDNKKVRLPEEKAGLLMIFRTFEKTSYGIVLSASRPMEIMDTVRNPGS